MAKTIEFKEEHGIKTSALIRKSYVIVEQWNDNKNRSMVVLSLSELKQMVEEMEGKR